MRPFAFGRSCHVASRPSTDRLLAGLLAAMVSHGVRAKSRALTHNINPGVLSDMGKGEEWPASNAAHLAKLLKTEIYIQAFDPNQVQADRMVSISTVSTCCANR
ncbi:exported hypothetical protein [Mesorhizobium metallidurans STM 2683]|uniref:Uncharacterized protein n=1 Tax=Mesorhizobium metallidurans STM 2683 TaxID=1297569 RepID=M5ENL2_9HYPH|nr:exported hypothetical protein [Mesorhizobium metallidurans STM 2683]